MKKCGEVPPLTEPDPVGLMERYGSAEHFVIQVDFYAQPWRNPRVEFSIPRASKTGRRWNTLAVLLDNIRHALSENATMKTDFMTTGYADIVDTFINAIWEIKPKNYSGKNAPPAVDYDTRASKEAEWYVVHASRNCSYVRPPWHQGLNYYPLRRTIDGSSVVFEFQLPDMPKAQLIADQYMPGSVLYHWEIDGKENPAFALKFSWALRSLVVSSYFPKGLPSASYVDEAPFDIPLPEFKPPEVSDIATPLFGFRQAIQDAIRGLSAAMIVSGAAVVMMLDELTYLRVVGFLPGQSPQPVSKDVEALQDATMSELGQVALIVGAIAVVAFVVAPVAIPLAAVALEAISVEVIAYAAAGATVGAVMLTSRTAEAHPVQTGPIGSLNRSLSQIGSQIGRIGDRTNIFTLLVPRGGSSVGNFATEEAKAASPPKLATLEAVMPKYQVLTPREAMQVRLHQTRIIDGKKHIIVAVAR